MKFAEIPHRLNSLLHPPDPIVINHTITVEGAEQKKTACYDIEVEVSLTDGGGVEEGARKRLGKYRRVIWKVALWNGCFHLAIGGSILVGDLFIYLVICETICFSFERNFGLSLLVCVAFYSFML